MFSRDLTEWLIQLRYIFSIKIIDLCYGRKHLFWIICYTYDVISSFCWNRFHLISLKDLKRVQTSSFINRKNRHLQSLRITKKVAKSIVFHNFPRHSIKTKKIKSITSKFVWQIIELLNQAPVLISPEQLIDSFIFSLT